MSPIIESWMLEACNTGIVYYTRSTRFEDLCEIFRDPRNQDATYDYQPVRYISLAKEDYKYYEKIGGTYPYVTEPAMVLFLDKDEVPRLGVWSRPKDYLGV